MGLNPSPAAYFIAQRSEGVAPPAEEGHQGQDRQNEQDRMDDDAAGYGDDQKDDSED
jgi:hypothetical protein